MTELSLQQIRDARKCLVSVEEHLHNSHKKTSHLKPLFEVWAEVFDYKVAQIEARESTEYKFINSNSHSPYDDIASAYRIVRGPNPTDIPSILRKDPIK